MMMLPARIPENENVAVLFGDTHLSYRQLHARARRIARKLKDLRVGPETPVGLGLPRSLDLMPAILGIWKAGGAYVPIDPKYPRERRETILQDAGIRVMVTPEFLADLPEEEFEVPAWEADSLAYILYTSGSTGRPNGVAVNHGSLMNFVEAARSETDFQQTDTVLAVGPFAFDITVMEFYLPLFTGARLAIPNPGEDVARAAARFHPSMMIVTPAAWRLLLDAGWHGGPEFKAVAAGDVLPRTLANQILERAGALWNGYGPTETTCIAAFARVEAGDGPVPIGRAVDNVRLLVLDENRQPVCEGELYIGGAGVARGYWKRPELTEERFLETEFGRVYRTGDLVRVLPDGQLQFLGRMDDQLKVWGVRIEPGEVETALALHAGVRDVAISAADDRLTAHVVGDVGEQELRAFAEAKLPAALRPARIRFLPSIPLTVNGKVDREALAKLGEDPPRDYSSPGTQIEKFLALIFEEVLAVERVSVEDNFFHLGGNSLLAARVTARVWETWKVDLPADVLFDSPTVRGLARWIEVSHSASSNGTGTIHRRREGRTTRRLSFSEERLWFLQEFHQSALYNVVMVVRLTGDVDADRLQRALDEVVQRHEPLRTNFGLEEATVRQAPVAISLARTHEPGRPFNLRKDRLVRASLAKTGEREFELTVTVHHIVFDGWSVEVFIRELGALYAGEELEPLPIQYSDYVEWQRERLTGPLLANQLSYWSNKLGGLKGLLELPTDRPRPAMQTYRGAQLIVELPAELSKAIEVWSRRTGATVFMTLFSAFQVLLSRYTGETDLCIGTAVAGRTRKETENLIGLFINTLALRTNIPMTATFRAAVAAVRATVLEAVAHQEVPFERVLEALDVPRTLSHSPLFQVMFTQVEMLPRGLDLPGVKSGPVEIRSDMARFDLTVNLDRVDPVKFTFEYNTDLFDEATIRRMGGHLETLLSAAVAEPDRSLGTLPLLTGDERRTMLGEWNRTEAPIPADLQIEVEAAAVVPDTLVAVSSARSATLPDELAGIWKAGAAYLPVDPSYPKERREFMIADSGLEDAAGLAYVIYTSGSTGRPKGVAVPRSAALNLLEAMRVEVEITAGDVFVAVTTLSFDIAFLELFLPRFAGARVVVASAEEAADGRLLRALLERSGATMMQATPATWRMLIDAGWRGSLGFKILCGGEAMPRQLANALLDRGAAVWNLFGPTETTVWSLAAKVQRGDGPVPIGRPLANTRVYVLDEREEPAPIGVPGELYIGGAGLARGYVNQPELTRERFVERGEWGRLYRTGDLVRWRADGQLEFIERMDQQVKLRGYRIEVGEIELALEKHPSIRAAAVALEDEKLVAWLLGEPVANAELRQWLSERLPGYMVPAHFFFEVSLPLTGNGKLDRRALPSLRDRKVALDQTPAAAADELESRLVEIWEAVLEQTPVSTTASFFELGGQSLQAVRLVMRIEEETGKQIPLSVLFGSPTVRQIAAYIRQHTTAAIVPGIAAIQPHGWKRPVFLVEARSLFWKLGQLLGPGQPLFGLEWPAVEELGAPVTFEKIAAHHVKTIRAQQPHGPYVVGGWCIAAIVAWEIAQQLTAAGEQVELVMLFDGSNPAPFLDAPYQERVGKTMTKMMASAAFHYGYLSKLPAAERLPYVGARWHTFVWVTKRWLGHFLGSESEDSPKAISKALLQAMVKYRPKRYSGRVAYFRRGHVPNKGYFEPDYGWGRLMDRELEVYKTGGRHQEMFVSPNVEPMAAIIRDLLAGK
jgi:amino acid adenylation domain-containing protein